MYKLHKNYVQNYILNIKNITVITKNIEQIVKLLSNKLTSKNETNI